MNENIPAWISILTLFLGLGIGWISCICFNVETEKRFAQRVDDRELYDK